MKWIAAPGSLPAHVPDIAMEPPRFPHDFDDDFEPSADSAAEPDAWRLNVKAPDEPALTLERYWELRELGEFPIQPTDAETKRIAARLAAEPKREVFDDFTIDAEIIVDRVGVGPFQWEDLAELFGVGRTTVYRWKTSGVLPQPATPGETGISEGLWSRAQVVEALGAHLRSKAARHG